MVKQYVNISIPKGLIDEMDKFIKENPQYSSRSELAKESIRTTIMNVRLMKK